MPPKKVATTATATTTTKPSKSSSASHPSYQDMIKEAIISLKERNGSSRQAIKKYVQLNNNLTSVTDNAFTVQFNKALQRGSESGVFARPKGTSGPVKLAAPKSADSKSASKTAKSPAAKKASSITKKAPGTKKTTVAATTATPTVSTPSTTTTKKVPTKKTTSSTKKATAEKDTKANTGATRKTKATGTSASAVEGKDADVLGKTKSGRLTKSNVPQNARKAATVKKSAAKRVTPKKAKA